MRNNVPPSREQRGKGQQSRVISARLHPDDEKEAQALAYVDMLLDEDFTMRQILTDAILYRQGHRPEMYREQTDRGLDFAEINAKLDAILNTLEEQLPSMLRNIRQSDPEGLRRFASSETGDELDAAFIENSRKAVRKTFRQKNG